VVFGLSRFAAGSAHRSSSEAVVTTEAVATVAATGGGGRKSRLLLQFSLLKQQFADAALNLAAHCSCLQCETCVHETLE
jgi:hypothetical protein